MNAVYFVVNSLSKVGYNDITVSEIEKVYVIVLNSFGLFILGYFISEIYLIVSFNF